MTIEISAVKGLKGQVIHLQGTNEKDENPLQVSFTVVSEVITETMIEKILKGLLNGIIEKKLFTKD